jgi:hypothetical protein
LATENILISLIQVFSNPVLEAVQILRFFQIATKKSSNPSPTASHCLQPPEHEHETSKETLTPAIKRSSSTQRSWRCGLPSTNSSAYFTQAAAFQSLAANKLPRHLFD